jgi:uncharacterized membrane protein
MKTQHALVAAGILTVAAFAYSLSVYSALPERIPTHWNIRGQVDGWSGRQFGAFFAPGLVAVFGLLLVALPWLSPRNFKIDDFRQTFNYVMVVMMALFVYLGVVSLTAALRPDLDVGRAVVIGICILLALIGNVLGKVRRNFWMGVRTPWTLASDEVWIATHRLAARLMVAGGVLGAVAVLLSGSPVLAFVLIMLAAFVPVVYSLVLYKRLEREGRLGGDEGTRG